MSDRYYNYSELADKMRQLATRLEIAAGRLESPTLRKGREAATLQQALVDAVKLKDLIDQAMFATDVGLPSELQ